MTRINFFFLVLTIIILPCILLVACLSSNFEDNMRSRQPAMADVSRHLAGELSMTNCNLTDDSRHLAEELAEKKCNLTKDLRKLPEQLSNDLRRLAADLSETQRTLVNSPLHFHRIERNIELVQKLIKSLDGKLAQLDNTPSPSSSSNSTSSAQKKEVCPEKFMGKDAYYGYPFYRTGFEKVNCTDFVPINQLVTMIVTSPEELPQEKLQNLFQGIATYYPRVPVMFVSKKNVNLTSLKEPVFNLTSVVFDDLAHGETWSKLLKMVTTPYVLFSINITYFTDDVNLERLARVLSDNKDTIIAGGSHKNQRGEWDKGCFQMSFRNWTAYFVNGYYHSFSDCVVCDLLSTPFMAKTKGLRDVGFDEKLHFGAFEDLFWRIKTKHPEKVVVSCPDVMFDTFEQEVPDEKYVALAEKWSVKRWVESTGRVRWFGCRKGGRPNDNKASCSKSQTGLAVPPCDLENLLDIVIFIMKECETAGIYCQLNEGTQLGAVKFEKIVPWERDADIRFLSDNYTAFQKLRPRFEAAGYRFVDYKKAECCNEDGRMTKGAFEIYKNGWGIDIYGIPTVESEQLVLNGQLPTKVKLSGHWLTAYRNQGLSARNRYGPEIYRHAEHLVFMGFSGHDQYKSGVYKKCPKPGHSGCLDQFPVDGSLPFSDSPFI